MRRFIHTADWQLGMSRRFLSVEAQARFAQDRIDAIRRIGELAREHEAEFIAVCGDVFESNQVDRQTIVRALDAMATIATPVVLLPGNHDPLDAGSVYRSRTFLEKKPAHVIVAERAGGVEIPGVTGCEIIAAPWESKRPLTDLTGDACMGLEQAPGTSRIVMGHGMVDSLSPDPDDPALIDLERLERVLGDGLVSYVALGDRHSVTQIGATDAVWYSGSPEGTNFGEERAGHVLLVEIGADEERAVTELTMGRWSFLERTFEFRQAEDVDALTGWLSGLSDKERTVIRLTLRGSLSLADKARLDETLADNKELFAGLNLWERHSDLVVVPDGLDLE